MLTDDLRRHANKYYGKYRGIVVDNADPKFQGVISVKVPSVFGEDATVLAKACMPYGHYFVPPVDARVWVEFEEGERTSAIWSGAWYPQGKAPVQAQVSPPESRVIQTPAGHTIQIVDKAGEEQILIQHAKDAFISIDSNGSILISNPNGSHIHLDADGKQATFVEQHGNYLVMNDKGTAIVNPDGTTMNIAGDTVHLKAGSVVVEAKSVALGMGASDPTIMGNAFDTYWKALLLHT
ncbi:MAG TPA: phage baseplate assembly protein V, partial [Dehalococcoidia bacterium]|nr:phage baseplate assembly protein V [Dehalococcoidia bacterium]